MIFGSRSRLARERRTVTAMIAVYCRHRHGRHALCDACGGDLLQREDDREEVVQERLRVYRKHTAPLLNLYRARGILREVDGAGGPEEVFGRLREAMGSVTT